MAVNPVTNKIYVANYGGNSCNGDRRSDQRRRRGGGRHFSYAVAVNPVTNKIYVANYASATVTVIDGSTN